MKSGTITIGKKSYPYVFNMKARRLFMERFKLKSFQDYADKIACLEGSEKGLTLEHIDVVGALVITAIDSAIKEDSGLDPDTVWDHFEENPGALEEFMADFAERQEQPDKSKKSNPSSSGGKSKKGKS